MRVSVGLKCEASTDNFLPFSVERERGRASSLGLGKGITKKHRGSATDHGHSLGDPLMGHHDRLWPCAGSQYWPTSGGWLIYFSLLGVLGPSVKSSSEPRLLSVFLYLYFVIITVAPYHT